VMDPVVATSTYTMLHGSTTVMCRDSSFRDSLVEVFACARVCVLAG